NFLDGKPDDATPFRTGGPQWKDFEEGYVYCDRKILGSLESELEIRMNNLVLARSGEGKTTLAKALGRYLLDTKEWSFVYFLNPSFGIGCDTDSIVNALSEISENLQEHEKYRKKRVLVVVDDAHMKEAKHFVTRIINNFTIFDSNIRFLMLARRLREEIESERVYWQKDLADRIEENEFKICFLEDLKYGKDYSKRAISGFLKIVSNYSKLELIPDKENVEKKLTTVTKGNLRFVSLLLQEIVKTKEVDSINAVQIDLDSLCKSANDHYDKLISQLCLEETKLHPDNISESTNELLRRLAILSVIEAPAHRDFLWTNLGNLGASITSFLHEKGEIVESNIDGQRYYSLSHRSMGEVLLKCRFQEDLQFIEERWTDYLRFCVTEEIPSPIVEIVSHGSECAIA
ncbi:unnamed protein product, partial [marine sediment metagenome]